MTSVLPGDQIDHYRLESLIARGGMASVYRGTDVRSGAAVAIKIPHLEAECDPVFYDRFQREEQLGRLMDHPGVVKEISQGKKSSVYMVLEWAEGRLLREVITREGPLPPHRAVAIAVDICDALEHIHSHGVVHRDLKPENIILDSHDRIKLIDFGIASQRGARRLTFGKFARLTGTADYIAPEQIKGKRGDARTDIYAMGVLLFEMLTGTVPFEGENLLAVMNLRLHQDAPPVRESNAAISPELETIIRRALARDPEDRYRSAGDLAWDLRHQQQVRSIEPPPITPGWRERFRPVRPWRTLFSRQALLYAALAMIPMLLFGLMLFVARMA